MKTPMQKPNHRLLIIDDNSAIHADFRKILCPKDEGNTEMLAIESILFGEAPPAVARLKFEVDSAHQGQEGLEMVKRALAENRPYALAFVDVRMPPGWDGVETIARIWEVYPKIQIIVCTAYADYSWEELRARVGQPDNLVVLKKPFDNVEVQQLAHAMTQKWLLNRQVDLQMEELEARVQHRTAELEKSQAVLQVSLREKESLLKEVHHRVKNNLQIINSLLRMETGRHPEDAASHVLRDMQGRIRSMALLHESLYRSGSLASVDLGDYVKNLANQTFGSLIGQTHKIRLQVDVDSVQVAMDQALPCGLILNELMANAIKHAFPENKSGEISVQLKPVKGGPQFRLSVSDTGVGLPANFKERSEKSLGVNLFRDLARQLEGEWEVGPGSAAHFAVVFKPEIP
jgi:two-component sensor histidine kinase